MKGNARSEARAPTILDVARLAGTSKSTVSNVIRNADGVASETQRRVLAAIGQLGYRPNVLARQLVQQKTTILGVVVGDLANPFHAEMVKQIQRFALKHGFQTMSVPGHEDGSRSVESLLDYRAVGIIFLSYSGISQSVRQLLDGRVPTVFVTCYADWGDRVVVNDFRGGEIATKHLIDLGHKRIGHFTDPGTVDEADRARESGYRRTMRRAGLAPVILHWDRSSTYLVVDGETMTPQAVFSGDKAITAIFASNDISAIKVLDCADHIGRAVPRELSVVGFDDVMFAGLARVDLTTIAQPQERIARLSLEVVADRISGRLSGPPVSKIVEAKLVLRGSTAEARG